MKLRKSVSVLMRLCDSVLVRSCDELLSVMGGPLVNSAQRVITIQKLSH